MTTNISDERLKELAAKRAFIDRLRTWAKALDSWPLRRAYAGWLNYYSREIRSARCELRWKFTLHSHERYEQRSAKKEALRQRYLEKCQPPPPTTKEGKK